MASESRRRSVLLASLLVVSLLLVSVPAFASGGEAAAEGHAGPNWVELGAALANFAVYIWLMVRYGAAPLKAHFEGRRAKIASAIEEAKAAAERAEMALRAAKEQFAGLAAIRARILSDSEAVAVADAAKVVAGAEVSAAKMVVDAAQLLEREATAADAMYRHRLVEAAMAQAREELSRGLTPEIQHRLIDAGIDRLSKQSGSAHTSLA